MYEDISQSMPCFDVEIKYPCVLHSPRENKLIDKNIFSFTFLCIVFHFNVNDPVCNAIRTDF